MANSSRTPAVKFQCGDCQHMFVYTGDDEPPDYCGECEREIRLTGTRESVRKREHYNDLERVWGMAVNALDSIQTLYERGAWEEVKRLFRPDGYVYLLGALDGGFYKIGRSKNVSRRLRQLEIQLPWPVDLLHTIPCEDHAKSEAALHRRFRHRRANGEWFALSVGDVDSIRSITRMHGAKIEGSNVVSLHAGRSPFGRSE